MSFAFCITLSMIFFALDQLSKFWVINSLKPVGSINIISGLLSFTYVENTGAAFGIFQGQRGLLIAIVLLIVCAALWALYTNKFSNPLERLSISMIISGGLGNLLDRVRYGFVVDFIDINQLFEYPMFNVADCFVVVGAILMVAAVMFEDSLNKKLLKQEMEQLKTEQGNDNADSDNGNS